MTFSPQNSLTVQLHAAADNSLWLMVCQPTCPKSDTALSSLQNSQMYLEEVAERMLVMTEALREFPTPENPLKASIQNNDHQTVELAFWMEPAGHAIDG